MPRPPLEALLPTPLRSQKPAPHSSPCALQGSGATLPSAPWGRHKQNASIPLHTSSLPIGNPLGANDPPSPHAPDIPPRLVFQKDHPHCSPPTPKQVTPEPVHPFPSPSLPGNPSPRCAPIPHLSPTPPQVPPTPPKVQSPQEHSSPTPLPPNDPPLPLPARSREPQNDYSNYLESDKSIPSFPIPQPTFPLYCFSLNFQSPQPLAPISFFDSPALIFAKHLGCSLPAGS